MILGDGFVINVVAIEAIWDDHVAALERAFPEENILRASNLVVVEK